MHILSIDPGLNSIGYGILKIYNNKLHYITSGYINLKKDTFFNKLKIIYNRILLIIHEFNPKYSVIEKIFIGNKNMDSSLKLCHARGVIIIALMNFNIPIFECTSTQVKKYIFNNICYSKNNIKNFVKNQFNLPNLSNIDEADALIIAVTYFYFIKK